MVCLANKFGDKCAKATADKLGVLYLNVDDYIEYALGDMGEMLFKCGREYLEGQINLHTNKAIDFENTLFYCGYKTFMKNKKNPRPRIVLCGTSRLWGEWMMRRNAAVYRRALSSLSPFTVSNVQSPGQGVCDGHEFRQVTC